jgi:hypothetical protein
LIYFQNDPLYNACSCSQGAYVALGGLYEKPQRDYFMTNQLYKKVRIAKFKLVIDQEYPWQSVPPAVGAYIKKQLPDTRCIIPEDEEGEWDLL